MINPLSNPSYLLPPLVVASIIVTLAILVWEKGRRDFNSQLFIAFLVMLGMWAVFTFAMRSSPDVHQALPWERAIIAAGMTAFAVYYHFTLAYANIKIKRWTVPALYSSMVAFAIVLIATDWAIEGMRLADYGYALVIGRFGYLFFAPAILCVIGGAYNLLKQWMASTSYEERNRLIYLVVAALFPLIGAGLDAFSDLPPAAIWSNLAFCTVCTIAFLKYHLLDIRVVVRKGLAYLLTSTAVASAYIGALTLLNWRLGATNVPVWIHVLLVILLAFSLHPLWRRAQHVVDRLFYRQRYDFLRELEHFSRETHDITDIRQLGYSLVKLVNRALQTASAYLLLRSESGDFTTVASVGNNTAPLTVKSHNPVLEWLQSHKDTLYQRDLSIIPQFQALTSRERKELAERGTELLVALKTRKGQLVGLLVLGRKLSHQSYSWEDEHLVLTVADRATVELENARLYSELLRDVTERKQAKEREQQLQEQLSLSSRLASVGELAAGVAHEINNPLTGILGFSQRLLRKCTGQKVRQDLERIHGEAMRAAKVVQNLLVFARHREPNKQYSDINDIVQKTLELRAYELKTSNVEVVTELAPGLPKTMVDFHQTQEVFLNIILNAEQVMTEANRGGKLSIKTQEMKRYIRISFTDDGPGIPTEHLNKVFDPFFTLRRERGGTGLGLSISHGIVTKHGGRIYVRSKPGKGATFIVELPLTTQNTEQGEVMEQQLA